MSKVFIIGAAGKVGRRLVRRLAENGSVPLAMYRDPSQAESLAALGATPVAGDLLALDAVALAGLMEGCDALVFSAGAGGKGGEEMTNAIDGRGLELAVAAARQAGVRRFLLVSAFPEAGRGRQLSDTFENYMRVKKAADVHLAQSDLDWLIVRPGTLTDEPGHGKIQAGPAIPYGNISRDDLAATLAELLERPQLKRLIIELTQGDTPIAEALSALPR